MLAGRLYIYAKSFFFVLFGLGLALPSFAVGNSGITYHGRVLNPDLTPVNDSNTQFKLQIRTPDSQSCLMYEEIQAKDLSVSSGAFSITMNDGTGTRTDSSGYNIDRIFANYGNLSFVPATCTTGSGAWSPNNSDGRTFQVYFKTTSMATWEPLPSQSINFIPLAIEAKQVAGYPATSLFRVENGTGPQTVTSLTPAQATALLNLSNGTSTAYVQAGANGASLPSFASNPSSPTAGQVWYDSTNKLVKYYDGTTIQTVGSGGAVSGNSITSGTIGGTTSVNTTGTVTAASVSSTTDSTNALRLFENTNTFKVTLTVPSSLAADYPLQLPGALPTATNQFLVSDTSGVMKWSPSMGIDASGNVGIGTTAPVSILEVKGGVSNSINYVGSGTTKMRLGQTNTADDFQLRVNGVMSGGSQDDATKASWAMRMGPAQDDWGVFRQPAGGGGYNNLLTVKGATGNVGIGTTAPSVNLQVDGTTQSEIRARESGSGVYAKVQANSTGEVRMDAYAPTGGPALSLNPIANDGTSNAIVRAFRATNTSGSRQFQILKGDGTNTIDSVISVGANSYLNASGGNVGIGTATPAGNLAIDNTGHNATLCLNGSCVSSLAAGGGGGTSTASQVFNSNSDGTGSDGGFNFQSNGSNLITIANNGDTAITSTTASSSPSTGALVVGGGLGVGAALNVTGAITGSNAIFSKASNNTAYASSGATASPAGSTPAFSVINTASADGEAGYYNFSVKNANSNGQGAYIAGISNAGAGVYTPSIVIGQQTGSSSYAERIRIDSAGNVGIGTTTPQGILDVQGGVAASGAGTPITLVAQQGAGLNAGGAVNITGGLGGAGGQGNGGALNLTGGESTLGGSYTGGAVNITGGIGYKGTGGSVAISAGTSGVGGGSGNGGNISLTASNAFASGNGGKVTLTAGAAAGAGTAGAILLAGGNVGVGTTTPAALLNISGNTSAASWTTTGRMLAVDASILTDTTGSGAISARAANSIASSTMAASSAETLTNASTLYIAGPPAAGTNVTLTNPLALNVASGNSYMARLNIGTVSPSYEFYVAGNSVLSNSGASIITPLALMNGTTAATDVGVGLSFNGSASSNIAQVGAAFGTATTEGYLSFKTRSSNSLTEKMRIDGFGNVGIGTVTPAGNLAIDNTGHNATLCLNGSCVSSLAAGGGGGTSTSSQIFNSNSDGTGSDGGFNFQANGSNLMTIANNGDTAITSTTTSTTSSTGAFVVAGGAGVAGALNVGGSVSSGANTITLNNLGVTSTDGLLITNTTNGAAGAPQTSPRLRFHSSGYDTTNTTAKTADIILESKNFSNAATASGSSNPTFAISQSISGGAFGAVLSWDQYRNSFFGGGVTAATSVSTTGGPVASSNSGSGTTPFDGLVATESSAATSGVPVQISPRLRLRSQVWDTGTVANKTSDWSIEALPTSGNPATDTLRIGNSMNGGAYNYPVYVTSGGSVGIGTTSPFMPLSIYTTATSSDRGANITYNAADANGSILRLWKSHNGAVQNGDELTRLSIAGYDGSSWIESSKISAYVESAPSTGIVPTFLSFQTMNTSGTLAERIHVSSNGYVGLGTSSPGNALQVEGSDSGAYTSTSAGANYPGSGVASLLVKNNYAAANGTGAYLVLDSMNAGTLNAYAYLGAVGSTTNYIPNIVIGTRTGASSYSERMRIDSSGNVGIGTTTPAGNLAIDNTGHTATLCLNGTCTSTIGSGSGGTSTTSQTFNSNSDGTGSDGGFNFQNNGTNVLTINNAGDTKVISTTASSSATTGALVVGGGVGIGGGLNVSGATNLASSLQTVDTLSTYNSSGTYAATGSSSMFPNSAGGLIGEKNSSTVDGTYTLFYQGVKNASGNDQTSYIATVSTTGAGYSPSLVFGTQSGATAYAERMRIGSNGNVGIGMTAPTHSLTLGTSSSAAIYNAFTDTSNYERGFERWSSNELQIGTEAAGTGTVRNMRVGTFGTGTVNSTLTLTAGDGASGGTGYIYLKANGTNAIVANQFNTTIGNALFMSGNTIYGSQASGGNLTFASNNTATAGSYIFNFGNVGIGTTTPDRFLTIANQAGSESANTKFLLLKQPNNYGYSFNIDDLGTGRMWVKGLNNGTESTTIMTLDRNLNSASDAKMGVGSAATSPGATFHVAPISVTAGTTPTMKVSPAANTGQTASTEIADVDFALNRTVQWATGALTTQRAFKIQPPTLGFVGASTVTDAATVGITGAPVQGTNATLTNTHALLINAGAVSTATNSYGLTVNAQTGATNNYAAAFSGGSVGIGTTSPAVALDVVGNIRGSSSVQLPNANNSLNVPAANSLALTTNSVERIRIDSAGKVGIGTTTPTEVLDVNGNVRASSFISTSDVRMKKNIQTSAGLDAVLKLRGVSWQWKTNDEHDAGVIAQEIEEVFPDAVRTNPETGYKGVKYQYLFAPLIESTKELYGMCTQQSRAIATVDAKVGVLEKQVYDLKTENEQLRLRLEKIEKMLGEREAK